MCFYERTPSMFPIALRLSIFASWVIPANVLQQLPALDSKKTNGLADCDRIGCEVAYLQS